MFVTFTDTGGTMTNSDEGLRRVEVAFKAAVGDRASMLMHRRSKHLANLTPHEVARDPHGARIVMSELDKIVLQARGLERIEGREP